MLHSAGLFFALATIVAGPPPLKSGRTLTRDQAAHLLRRAGFGGTPDQIDELVRLGRRRAVDSLLNYEKIPEDAPDLRVELKPPPRRMNQAGMDEKELEQLRAARRRADQLHFNRVVRGWLGHMASTRRPAQEKLVLFWHGHFTSGYREVKSSYAMWLQNELFRRHAAGNFRDLLLAVTEDPAMMLYLNTLQNRKGRPNENYARELLELFTMGPGHYTERDIAEAARALTGIAIDPETAEVFYRPRLHDYGEKTFLGRTGNWDPADIIDIILVQPATAEFIARKFWSFYAYEDPEPEIVAALAAVLRKNRYEIRPMLRAMFTSDAFYGRRAMFTHIKSPVELLVGTLRMLEIPPRDTAVMQLMLVRMGQQLMQPPNVKGWDGGASWITTSTLYNRYNCICRVLEGTDDPRLQRQREQMRRRLTDTFGAEAMVDAEDIPPPQPAYDPMIVVRAERLDSVEEVVDYFVRRLLQRRIDPQRRQILVDALRDLIGGRDIRDPASAAAVRSLLQIIVSMPEYQLS